MESHRVKHLLLQVIEARSSTMADICSIFHTLDIDGDGYVGSGELFDRLPGLIVSELSRDESDALFEELDYDRDNGISLEDFIRFSSRHLPEGSLDLPVESDSVDHQSLCNELAMKLRSSILKRQSGVRNAKQAVKKAFQALDVDGNGNLSSSELRQFIEAEDLGLLESLPEDMPSEEKILYIDMLVEQIDKNKDGAVTLNELQGFLFPKAIEDYSKKDKTSIDVKTILKLVRKVCTMIR